MKVFFVTGNQFKFELAKSKLNFGENICLEQKKFDCLEIQANTIQDVAAFSAKYSADHLGVPCIKNDSGLLIDSLNNFPGPYTKYAEETIKETGILCLMSDMPERGAKFVEILAYCEPQKEPVLFECVTDGEIAKEVRGDGGWGLDKIFVPRGSNKTLAEFNDQERISLWDNSGYQKLAEYLNKMYEGN